MAPKNIGPKAMTKAQKKAAGVKMHNGIVVGMKSHVAPKEALKAGFLELLRKPAKPKHVAGARVTHDSKGRRVAADPDYVTCEKCAGTGVESYNPIFGTEKRCTAKGCKGNGWVLSE